MSSVPSFCGAPSIKRAHPLVRPAHTIAAPPSPISASASHRRATKSYLGWRIPSPAPPYLILAGASLPRCHSVLVSASLLRHSILAAASLPRRVFYPSRRIIVAPPFYLGWHIIATPLFPSWLAHHCHAAILSWPAHHCHATIFILTGAALPRRHILSRLANHCLVQQSDCEPIFSSAAPLCAIPASTKESSSCLLVTIPPRANLLFSCAIKRCSANNPLTPSQRLTLRLPPPSQLDCCHLPAPASPLQDAYAH